MAVGPIQVVLFGFDRIDQFKGEILRELLKLRGRGVIRLIDAFVAIKRESGEIEAVEMSDLTDTEKAEFGQVIGALLGLGPEAVSDFPAEAVDLTLAAVSDSVGLEAAGIREIVANLEPGTAVGVLMYEHTWAIPLRDAIRGAGGRPLAQGFLTPETLVMVGAELAAISDAEETIEMAEAVKTAAILDALMTVEAAAAVKTAVVAETLRTLILADLIEKTAVQEAMETLALAGLLEESALAAAAAKAGQTPAE